MILIKNGYLIDPKSGREGQFDVLLDGERVAKIAEKIEAEEGWEVLNAKGLMVAPGLVDVHVHFREPGFEQKEDITTGARAAARGGFTTVVLMANTKPTVDCKEVLDYVIRRGKETDINVTTCANVTMGMKGKELVPMEELAKEGAVGFTDDGIPLMDEQIVREAMERCAKLNLPISFHEENPALITNNGVNRGKASAHYGIGGSPREAEISLVERDLKLAEQTGVCIDIQHISAKESVELVRRAKKRGVNVHAEATPHHFTLTEEAVIQYGTLAKMNPPLREEEDRMAIIRGLQDGTIDLIATDHAPHTAEEKAKPITEAPSGIIGLETALPLGITSLVTEGYLTLKDLIEKMSTNPARMYHLDAGYLAEGGPADIVLFDPVNEYTVKDFASKASNSPFTGWRLRGGVTVTICKGKIVYRNEI
jgi:dihydroorotase